MMVADNNLIYFEWCWIMLLLILVKLLDKGLVNRLKWLICRWFPVIGGYMPDIPAPNRPLAALPAPFGLGVLACYPIAPYRPGEGPEGAYAQRRAGWPKVSARGIAWECELGGRTIGLWIKSPVNKVNSVGPISIPFPENTIFCNGSFTGHLRFLNESSGGTLDWWKLSGWWFSI